MKEEKGMWEEGKGEAKEMDNSKTHIGKDKNARRSSLHKGRKA